MRLLALLAGSICLAAGLGACGGGGSSSTTSNPSTSQSPSEAGAAQGSQPAKPGGGNSGSAGSGGGNATSGGSGSNGTAQTKSTGSPSGSGRSSTGKTRAAGAAGFVIPNGDNSIPEYGSEAPSSEQTEATASLRAYLEARAGGDWAGACAHMGTPVRRQLELLGKGSKGKSVDCEEAFVTLSKFGSASERANTLSGPLAAFRVKGDKAFALFYGPHNQQYMMPMVSEGGSWKVNQIGPVAWPVGSSPAGG